MGWSIGFDRNWNRDIGYGVPAYCDHPGCMAEIDRGLAYVCGGEPYGGEFGCGLYFCGSHLWHAEREERLYQLCERCQQADEHGEYGTNPFTPTKEHPEWIAHKLTHESWAEWRAEHPDEVKALKQNAASPTASGGSL